MSLNLTSSRFISIRVLHAQKKDSHKFQIFDRTSKQIVLRTRTNSAAKLPQNDRKHIQTAHDNEMAFAQTITVKKVVWELNSHSVGSRAYLRIPTETIHQNVTFANRNSESKEFWMITSNACTIFQEKFSLKLIR